MIKDTVIKTQDLQKIYNIGRIEVRALNGVSLSVERGEFVCVMGPSGCGKSTLLYLLGGLAKPTKGSVEVNGCQISKLTDIAVTRFRRNNIGFVFQMMNLLPTLTAIGNLELAKRISKGKDGFASKELLEMVGLDGKVNRHPFELSLGEQQRVAIARGIVNKPAILLADEPTGSLDSKNAQNILKILCDLNKKLNQTILLITHDPAVAESASRIVHMKDGAVVES